MQTALVFLVLSAVFFLASDHILAWMQSDVDVGLHGLTPFEVLNVRLGIAALFGFVATLPVLIYQFIDFARPGLTESEYRILKYSLPVSYLLFVIGSIFSYAVVFRNALEWFIGFTKGSEVEVVWGLSNTLMLGLRISLVTGFLFQLPLLIIVLNKSGLVSAEDLIRYRPYVIVVVLSVAAFATPPDLLTQVFITFPVVMLYELSIRFVSWM